MIIDIIRKRVADNNPFLWKYTKEQTTICSRLAKQFNHIALREESGVVLCQKTWRQMRQLY